MVGIMAKKRNKPLFSANALFARPNATVRSGSRFCEIRVPLKTQLWGFCGTLILRKNRLGGLLRNTLYLGFISIRTEQKSTRRDHSNEHGQASTKVNAYPASTSTR